MHMKQRNHMPFAILRVIRSNIYILHNPECIVVSEVGLFLSPNNPKREVNRTAKLGRINTVKWYTDYLAVN